MGAVYVASTDVQWRTYPTLYLEPMTSSGHAYDVGDGVDRAHFMKVNRLNRDIVYLRLGMTE